MFVSSLQHWVICNVDDWLIVATCNKVSYLIFYILQNKNLGLEQVTNSSVIAQNSAPTLNLVKSFCFFILQVTKFFLTKA